MNQITIKDGKLSVKTSQGEIDVNGVQIAKIEGDFVLDEDSASALIASYNNGFVLAYKSEEIPYWYECKNYGVLYSKDEDVLAEIANLNLCYKNAKTERTEERASLRKERTDFEDWSNQKKVKLNKLRTGMIVATICNIVAMLWNILN